MASKLSKGLERLKLNALCPGNIIADLEKTNFDALKPGDSSADVVVVCEEDVHMLHSTLLASKAGFFEAALSSPMVERSEGKINIREVEPDIFKKVVKFMYEQDLEFDHKKELEGVLDAADRFDFEELKTKVNEMVKDVLDQDNVLTTASLAELYNAKELLASCVEAMARLEVKLEAKYVIRSPRVVLALLEHFKEEARKKDVELAEKDEELRMLREDDDTDIYDLDDHQYRLRGYHDDSDDEDRWGGDNIVTNNLHQRFYGTGNDFTACDQECGYCGHCQY